MSDNPSRIIFADNRSQESNKQTETDHWSTEFNHYLVKYGYVTPEQSNLVVKNLTPTNNLPPEMRRRIDMWTMPQIGFGETIDPSDNLTVNKYLSRVIYEEMFQIAQPDGSGSQITSAGGLITHIEEGSQTSHNGDKHVNFLISSSIKIRNDLKNELNSTITTDSILKLASVFGIDVNELPTNVEGCFIKAWDILKNDITKVISSKSNNEASNYLRKLLAVRSLPEFQFLFKSPFFWIAVENNKPVNPLAKLSVETVMKDIMENYKGELRQDKTLPEEHIRSHVKSILAGPSRIYQIDDVPILANIVYDQITKDKNAEITIEHPAQKTTFRRINHEGKQYFIAHEAHDHTWGGLNQKKGADFVDKIYITDIDQIKRDIENQAYPYRSLKGDIQLLR